MGECSFFLQPHEKLQAGVQDAHILKQDEGLLIQALEAYDKKYKNTREFSHSTNFLNRMKGMLGTGHTKNYSFFRR